MKRHPRPVVALANTKKMLFAIFCCALLMLFAAPAWADPCSAPTIGTGAGTVSYDAAGTCSVVIKITGTSGHLVATVTGGVNPYDGSDDVLVGIQNNSSVTVGAIRLSGSSTFGFDGDGPCNINPRDCFAGPSPEANPFDYEGPDNTFVGVSPDYSTGTVLFTTPIPPDGSTWFALESTPTTVVSIGETQQLTTGVANVFPFGPFTCSGSCTPGMGIWTEQSNGDNFQFTPVSQLSHPDSWTFLPIPVCAGPLGESPFGPFTGTPSFGFGAGQFGIETPSPCPPGPPPFVTNFPVTYPNANSLACAPYSDYSSPNNPVCVELERDCSGLDCANLLWSGRLGYNLDPGSIAGTIGGPAVLWAPGVHGPTSPSPAPPAPYTAANTDFSANPITAYTGGAPATGADPPSNIGGEGGSSVFAAAFSPSLSETNPVPAGVTVGFPGFEIPTSDTSSPSCSPESAEYLLFPSGKQKAFVAPVNCLVKVLGVRLPWLLLWDYTTTSNTPITNLQLCPTVAANGTCSTPDVSTPWVHLSLVAVANCGAFAGQDPLSGIFTNLNGDGDSDDFPGQYSFLWEPVNNPKGCQVAPVLQFDNGTIASPAVFQYSY